jgi:hypothetical protein
MKSCKPRCHCCWVRKSATFARTHSIAFWRLGGRSWNWGWRIQSSCIWFGVVRNIHAMSAFAYCHISLPPPQMMRRCCSVSFWAQFLHVSVGAIFIWCSRSFVGIMSWMTLYKAIFVNSGIGAKRRFVHTVGRSVWGHFFSTRICWWPDMACILGFDLRTVQPVASRYTDWALRPTSKSVSR